MAQTPSPAILDNKVAQNEGYFSSFTNLLPKNMLSMNWNEPKPEPVIPVEVKTAVPKPEAPVPPPPQNPPKQVQPAPKEPEVDEIEALEPAGSEIFERKKATLAGKSSFVRKMMDSRVSNVKGFENCYNLTWKEAWERPNEWRKFDSFTDLFIFWNRLRLLVKKFDISLDTRVKGKTENKYAQLKVFYGNNLSVYIRAVVFHKLQRCVLYISQLEARLCECKTKDQKKLFLKKLKQGFEKYNEVMKLLAKLLKHGLLIHSFDWTDDIVKLYQNVKHQKVFLKEVASSYSYLERNLKVYNDLLHFRAEKDRFGPLPRKVPLKKLKEESVWTRDLETKHTPAVAVVSKPVVVTNVQTKPTAPAVVETPKPAVAQQPIEQENTSAVVNEPMPVIAETSTVAVAPKPKPVIPKPEVVEAPAPPPAPVSRSLNQETAVQKEVEPTVVYGTVPHQTRGFPVLPNSNTEAQFEDLNFDEESLGPLPASVSSGTEKFGEILRPTDPSVKDSIVEDSNGTLYVRVDQYESYIAEQVENLKKVKRDFKQILATCGTTMNAQTLSNFALLLGSVRAQLEQAQHGNGANGALQKQVQELQEELQLLKDKGRGTLVLDELEKEKPSEPEPKPTSSFMTRMKESILGTGKKEASPPPQQLQLSPVDKHLVDTTEEVEEGPPPLEDNEEVSKVEQVIALEEKGEEEKEKFKEEIIAVLKKKKKDEREIDDLFEPIEKKEKAKAPPAPPSGIPPALMKEIHKFKNNPGTSESEVVEEEDNKAGSQIEQTAGRSKRKIKKKKNRWGPKLV